MAVTMDQGGDAYIMKLKQQHLPEGFWMYSYKVVPCPYTYRHNWTHCPFAHSGETARRRDPTACAHAAELCPRVRCNKPCSDGDSCPFAHNLFEQYLHPTRYRTRLCYFGERCNRSTCFFAHNISELRAAPGEGGPPPEPYYATATELAAAIPAPQQLPPDHLHSMVSIQQRAAQQLATLPQHPLAPVVPSSSSDGGVGSGSIRHMPQIQTIPSTEHARQHYDMMVGISAPEQLQHSNRYSNQARSSPPHLHGSGGSGGMQAGLHSLPPGLTSVNTRPPPPRAMLVQGHADGRAGEHISGMSMKSLGLYPVGSGREEVRRPVPPSGPWPGPRPIEQQNAYGGGALYAPYDPSHQPQMVPVSEGMVTRYHQRQIQLQRQQAMDMDPGNRLQGWAASANAEYQQACRGHEQPYPPQQQQQTGYSNSPRYSHGGFPAPPHSFHQQHHRLQQQPQAMYALADCPPGTYYATADGGRMEAEAQWQLQQQLHYQQQQVLTQQHQQQRQQHSRANADVYSTQHVRQPMPHHHQQQQQQQQRVPTKNMMSADDANDSATFPEHVAAAVVAAAQRQAQILEVVPVSGILSSTTTTSVQQQQQQQQQQQSVSLSTASSLGVQQSGQGSRGQDLIQKQLATDGLSEAAEEAHYHARRYVSLSGNTYLAMPADYEGGLSFSGGLRPRVSADEQQRIRGSSYSGACYGSDIPLVPSGSDHLLPEFAAASAAVMTHGLDAQQRADMLAAAMAGSSPSALVEALQQQEAVRRASEANTFPLSSMRSGRMSYPGMGEGHTMGVHAPSLNPYSLSTGNSIALQQQQPLGQSWQQQQPQPQHAPDGALRQGEEMNDSLLQMLLGLGLGPFDKDTSMLPSRHSDPGQLQDCSMLTQNSLNMDYDPSLFMNRISDPSGGSAPSSVDPMLAELILALQTISSSGGFPQQQYQDEHVTRLGEGDFAPLQANSSGPLSRASSSGITAAPSLATSLQLRQFNGVSRANNREVGVAPCMLGGTPSDQAGGLTVGINAGSIGVAKGAEGYPEMPEFLRERLSRSSSTDVSITSGSAEAPSSLLRTASGTAMSAKLDAFVRHTLLPQLRDAGLTSEGSGAAVANQSADIATAIGKLLQQLLPGKGAAPAAAAAVAATAGAATDMSGGSGTVSSDL